MAPSTPDRSPARSEFNTIQRTRFYYIYDSKEKDISLGEVCKQLDFKLLPTTARSWIRKRENLGSLALRRTRKLSARLGRARYLHLIYRQSQISKIQSTKSRTKDRHKHSKISHLPILYSAMRIKMALAASRNAIHLRSQRQTSQFGFNTVKSTRRRLLLASGSTSGLLMRFISNQRSYKTRQNMSFVILGKRELLKRQNLQVQMLQFTVQLESPIITKDGLSSTRIQRNLQRKPTNLASLVKHSIRVMSSIDRQWRRGRQHSQRRKLHRKATQCLRSSMLRRSYVSILKRLEAQRSVFNTVFTFKKTVIYLTEISQRTILVLASNAMQIF